MRKRDNNCGEKLTDIEILNIGDLSSIANKNLIDLQKENPDLLVFPQTLGQYRDDVEKSHIFSLDEENLTTYNLMGFVGRNSSQLTISSRFAKDDNNDYFLHYMLQKVFSINLLKFDQTPTKENIWDFLLYLFPYYLKKAYSHGIYKAYKKEEYNDSNVKGTIDVKRHILRNIPFMGKIAYTTREHSYNNNLTQLVRHTIEHIKTHPFGSDVLTNDSEVRDIVSKFIFVTEKTFNNNSRQKIISANLKPVSHPYFTEYTALQKICLKILRHGKITFGKEKDKVYGLLFDGAWLWEEYLNKVLKDCGFEHPKNKTSSGAIYLFSDSRSYKRYPDFWKENFILDAKYKNLTEPIDRNDMNQIISYMYVKRAKIGGFIYPTKNFGKLEHKTIGKLNGFEGNVKTWCLSIPQASNNFKEFMKTMNENEQELRENLNTEERAIAQQHLQVIGGSVVK
jgi:5-methylcytosine-specific restriction endonuclease McrBC regulatory subunit McrC